MLIINNEMQPSIVLLTEHIWRDALPLLFVKVWISNANIKWFQALWRHTHACRHYSSPFSSVVWRFEGENMLIIHGMCLLLNYFHDQRKLKKKSVWESAPLSLSIPSDACLTTKFWLIELHSFNAERERESTPHSTIPLPSPALEIVRGFILNECLNSNCAC